MVIEKGNARINMHLNMIFDSYAMDKPYLAVQFLSRNQVIAATKQAAETSLLKAQGNWRSQLFVSSKRSPLSVIVARSEYHIEKKR